jgi:hypothetical protein
MAAAAWRLYAKAKQYLGNGTITLGTGGFKMALFRGSSSASTLTFSTFSQLSTRQASGGAYVAGGKYLFLLPVLGRFLVQRLRLTTPRWALPLRPRVL